MSKEVFTVFVTKNVVRIGRACRVTREQVASLKQVDQMAAAILDVDPNAQMIRDSPDAGFAELMHRLAQAILAEKSRDNVPWN